MLLQTSNFKPQTSNIHPHKNPRLTNLDRPVPQVIPFSTYISSIAQAELVLMTRTNHITHPIYPSIRKNRSRMRAFMSECKKIIPVSADTNCFTIHFCQSYMVLLKIELRLRFCNFIPVIIFQRDGEIVMVNGE